MAKARIEKYNGEPAIMIDGKPYAPMTFTSVRNDIDYLRHIGETGVRIYYLETWMKWNQPGNADKPDGTTKTLQEIENIMTAVPDAYIMIRLQINPSVDWINSHPEEQVLFNDGSREPVRCYSAGPGLVDGMVSFASKLWRKEGEIALKEYLSDLEKSPFFDRIIGIFLNAGGSAEWYYPGEHRMCNLIKNTYADFSEPFRSSYENYLRKKYKSVEELRNAWKKPDASFEKPIIPNMYERVHTDDFDRVTHARISKHNPPDGSIIRMKSDENTSPSNFGVFLNTNDYFYTADFFAALNEATADTIIFFSDVVKKYNQDLLVGAFYGYYGCTDYYNASHTTGALTIINSGKVDFLAGPGVYNNREPSGVTAQREMQDSMRIRNQIYICEDDIRTHLISDITQKKLSGLHTVKDSINVMKRDFARNICEDIQGWWFDMSERDGEEYWYNDTDILDLIRCQQEVAKFAYSLDRTKKNEIAVLYDTESVHMVSAEVDTIVLDYYRSSDLHRIGAPIDYYFHNDVVLEQMPDYKMYIVLNCYCLTEEERIAIHAKARRNKALVLWLYAPGFINPDSETTINLDNIEKTVGMKLCIKEGLSEPYFFTENTGHLAIRYADSYRRYGYIDRPVHSNLRTLSDMIPTPYLEPAFYIEDESVTVLGRYSEDDKVAYAMRDVDGYTSVYCTTQVLRSELIASLAEYAGCHLFIHTDDVLYANENFVGIHASTDGVKRVYFKEKCSPYEVYERKSYGNMVQYIDVEMYKGETKFFCLNIKMQETLRKAQ